MVHTSNAVIRSKGIRLAVSQTHWSILRRTATTLPGDPAAAAQANNRQGSFRKWSKKILTEYVVSKEILEAWRVSVAISCRLSVAQGLALDFCKRSWRLQSDVSSRQVHDIGCFGCVLIFIFQVWSIRCKPLVCDNLSLSAALLFIAQSIAATACQFQFPLFFRGFDNLAFPLPCALPCSASVHLQSLLWQCHALQEAFEDTKKRTLLDLLGTATAATWSLWTWSISPVVKLMNSLLRTQPMTSAYILWSRFYDQPSRHCQRAPGYWLNTQSATYFTATSSRVTVGLWKDWSQKA